MSKVAGILESMEYGPAPESAALAHEWIAAHEGKFGFYVGGEWTSASTTFDTFSPSTGKVIAQIGQASNADVDAAVEAASKAQAEWIKIGPSARAKYLYAVARQIQKHSRLFAVLESLDNGKPIRETRDIDIPLVARHFYYHAGWARLLDNEFDGYEPVGVCGQIIPWNFPLLMLSWKIAPALAIGNTVVLKPAEFTSLTALLFAEICEAIGLPAGVVNIVTGDGDSGRAIVEHPKVNKIAFTGSTEVGKIIRRATAKTDKKLSLELGGKSPFIVFEDADLDSVVEGVVDAIWFNQGQVCCAGSRLIVQEGVAEKLFRKIRARMDTLRIGDPLDKVVDIGAIIDITQLERITDLVQTGIAEGAICHQPKCSFPEGGWFYPPTLLTGVEPASTVAQVEIFGPVLVAMTFRTPAEAVAIANNTVYGLASSVWTQSLDVAHDIASKIKAGTVWINCTNQFDASAGFGGYRESGYGREGGREGLYEYLRVKLPTSATTQKHTQNQHNSANTIDKTHKLFIGGKQARSDSGYSLTVETPGGTIEVPRGNRKDIRNAVEANDSAASWATATAFNRSQILYYLAENMEGARATLEATVADANEVDQAIDRVMYYAALADKYDAETHKVPARMHVYTVREVIGTAAVVCPAESPLLGFISTCIPLIAMGNAITAIPSYNNPLPAMEMMRIIEASDIPAGVWNIITGTPDELEKTLGEHDGIQTIWHFGSKENGEMIQEVSAGNLKQTWCLLGKQIDWSATPSPEFLRRATQIKNVWVPYGA